MLEFLFDASVLIFESLLNDLILVLTFHNSLLLLLRMVEYVWINIDISIVSNEDINILTRSLSFI